VKFSVEYPLGSAEGDPDFAKGETVGRFARAAEEAGFDAVAFTDHPAPSHKWLESGGHETFDPLVALAGCALITSRVALMTNLLVLPYRNVFITAKAATTVDILSGGRLILALGSGYLRSEFGAVGVDFEERNAAFDEAFDLLPKIFAEQDISHEGRNFQARGQTLRPRAIQTPHPPLWVGGNSRIARRRVARGGQGWTPLIGSPEMARTTRTPAFSTIDELKAGIADLRVLLDEAGRGDAQIDIQVASISPRNGEGERSPEEYRDYLGQLAEIGVTWTIINPPPTSVEESLDLLASYAADFIQVQSGRSVPGR
jgi:probable F420-dependent oxidoreductase